LDYHKNVVTEKTDQRVVVHKALTLVLDLDLYWPQGRAQSCFNDLQTRIQCWL